MPVTTAFYHLHSRLKRLPVAFRVSRTPLSKGSYTPIGDTGIPPKQALERIIGDTGVKWGYKYPKMEWMYMQKALVALGYLLGRCLPNTYLLSIPLFIGISAMFR